MIGMLEWDYSDTRYLNLNLEEFKSGTIKETSTKISEHLEFNEKEASLLLDCFNKANNNKAVKKKHMTSGNSSNKEVFSQKVMDFMYQKYPNMQMFMKRFSD